MEKLDSAPDPWPYARRPNTVPDWDDPRQFWSRTLAAIHHLGHRAQFQAGMPGRAKSFWELLQSCAPLQGLWDHRPVDDVHAAVLALAAVHWRGLVERNYQRPPAGTDKQERRYWALWAKWLTQTVQMLQDVPWDLIPSEERDRMLPVFTQAASKAAAWVKDSREGVVRFVQFTPEGVETILEIPSGKRVKRMPGRPANDRGAAIAGELAALDTFLRPFLGRGYWEIFAEIVGHFWGLEMFPERLRVRIAQVRRSHAMYVSRCEHYIRSLVSKRMIDPRDTAF